MKLSVTAHSHLGVFFRSYWLINYLDNMGGLCVERIIGFFTGVQTAFAGNL